METDMKRINDTAAKSCRPVKVLQFGEGNFLRAFADYMIDCANESGEYDGSAVLVQPIDAPLLPAFSEQDSVYTVILRGRENGATVDEPHIVTSVREVISSYADYGRFMEYASLETLECVISNTTEAGIVFDSEDRFDACPPRSYPGKLTKFLYERYRAFSGDPSRGLVIFPVELIEDNGHRLCECVKALSELWGLGAEFEEWITEACVFNSTLVDRIVTGYPKRPGEAEAICKKLGYSDSLLDICEPFGLWVIESPDTERSRRVMPLDRAGLPVIFTDDQKPYRERKVRILNGAHTSFVPAAYLAGFDIVRDCMGDGTVRHFIDACVYGEIVPTVHLPHEDVMSFASSVAERFENPFIDHELISICLNSVSKWRARVLPSLIDSLDSNGRLPECLTMSFASLCEFYSRGEMSEDGFFGWRESGGVRQKYRISDDAAVIDFFAAYGKEPDIIKRFASCAEFFGRDLSLIPGFTDAATAWLDVIRRDGTAAAMERASAGYNG